jgi:hypothetical protein
MREKFLLIYFGQPALDIGRSKADKGFIARAMTRLVRYQI